VRQYITNAWSTLEQLGRTKNVDANQVAFHKNAVDAVKHAQFIQENISENLELKHALFAKIEPQLLPDAITASSA
jgi:carnitine 3-dehydrogenase